MRMAGVMVRAFALVMLAQQGLVCAQEPAKPIPSLQELEVAGAKIGQIRIQSRNIFDTDDPKEDYLLFRWANALHVQTRPNVIERVLLFKTGDPLSVRLIEETERLLLRNRYLYEVEFRPSAYHDGVVDIDVVARDTWTIDLGITASRAGGSSSSGIHLKEYNLFGAGVAVGFDRSNTVDRSGNEFFFSHDHAFDTWTAVNFSHTANSDGKRDAASVISPFYALDTRWAAGVSAAKDDRVDAVYNAGEVVSQYRHRQDRGDVFGGWSPAAGRLGQALFPGNELPGRCLCLRAWAGSADPVAGGRETGGAVLAIRADRGPLREGVEPQPDRTA
jgi:hypothetical protein